MGSDTVHSYLIALGSNQRHVRYGLPREVLRAVPAALETRGIAVRAAAKVISSAPVGPSLRTYANSALLAQAPLLPHHMLDALQQVERDFGRERRGQRWRARTLDLDIILWSGGNFASPELTIPHPRFRERGFVLGPIATIAAEWRDPETGLTLRQLQARFRRPGPA